MKDCFELGAACVVFSNTNKQDVKPFFNSILNISTLLSFITLGSESQISVFKQCQSNT